MLFLLNEIETIDNFILFEKLNSNGVLLGKRCFYEIFLKSCVVSNLCLCGNHVGNFPHAVKGV